MRISDWSSDVCSSDLLARALAAPRLAGGRGQREIGVGVLRDEIKFDLGRDDRFPALVRIEAEHFLEDRSRRDVDFGPVAVEGVGDYEGRGRSETRRDADRVGVGDQYLVGILVPDVVDVLGKFGRASCRERVCQYG